VSPKRPSKQQCHRPLPGIPGIPGSSIPIKPPQLPPHILHIPVGLHPHMKGLITLTTTNNLTVPATLTPLTLHPQPPNLTVRSIFPQNRPRAGGWPVEQVFGHMHKVECMMTIAPWSLGINFDHKRNSRNTSRGVD
jgi:hypothetical protein